MGTSVNMIERAFEIAFPLRFKLLNVAIVESGSKHLQSKRLNDTSRTRSDANGGI
jgi:hypothetical protein